MPKPRSVTELLKVSAAFLKDDFPANGENRFLSMDLCEEIMDRHDLILYDDCLRETLRGEVGRIQFKFQGR